MIKVGIKRNSKQNCLNRAQVPVRLAITFQTPYGNFQLNAMKNQFIITNLFVTDKRGRHAGRTA